MELKELQFGDWVMVDDIEYKHPLQVTEIFKKSGTFYATLYWDGMPGDFMPNHLIADIDKILPIPLTKEILEKNGFEYHQGEVGIFGITISSYYSCTDTFRLYDDGYLFAVWFEEKVPIHYVHQLQHLLRLIGYEKEIMI